MDYLKTILSGYADINIREHFSNYLYREFRKAEKENYSEDEFFNGCMKIADEFINKIKSKYYDRQIELRESFDITKNEDAKEWFKSEYKALRLTDSHINLFHEVAPEYQFFSLLGYNDAISIKDSIIVAQGKCTQKIKSSPKDEINAADLKFFCGLVNDAGILIKGIKGNEVYAREVCKKYKLTYLGNTRKGLPIKLDFKAKNRYLIKVKRLILPNIPEPDREHLNNYIDSKISTFG